MSYKLPRFIPGHKERCVVLDGNTGRCRKIAKIEDSYHGDEIYELGYLEWVRVALCEKHFKTYDPDGYRDLVNKKRGRDETETV